MNARKTILGSITLLTFFIGIIAYLAWSNSTLPEFNKHEIASTQRVLIFIPARESQSMIVPYEAPKPSDQYMILAQNINPPLITEPISDNTFISDLIEHNCGSLQISIDSQHNLYLNNESIGTLSDTSELRIKLKSVFQQRIENRAYLRGMENRKDLPDIERIPRTVLINPSRSLEFGDVIGIIDTLEEAGASPIGLQIDNLSS